MAAYLSPIFGAAHQFFDNQGVILAGGKIWTYLAGTTTLQGTWTDSTQVTSNANPIILDSTGRTTTEIWLQASTLYKYIVTDSDDNQIGIAWDNIAGLNDITSSVTVSEWSATSLTPTYISATSFSVPGNNTATFTVNRRIQAVVSAGTIYGYVYSSTFSTVTTVVIVPDSTVLDSGISSVSVGLLDSTNVSVPNQYLAANAPVSIASASTTNIGAALSLTVSITGTTTITAFDTVLAGIYRYVSWTAATPVTYNVTNMQLIGGVSRTYSAGDFSIFRSLGSGNWKEEFYQTNLTTSFIPQNSQSAAYTTILGDANKHILHPSSDDNPRTFTIDSNANVPYPIGTTLTFVNQINTLTIAITSDTLTLTGGATGSRTLGANSIATALKIATTEWLISGTGIS